MQSKQARTFSLMLRQSLQFDYCADYLSISFLAFLELWGWILYEMHSDTGYVELLVSTCRMAGVKSEASGAVICHYINICTYSLLIRSRRVINSSSNEKTNVSKVPYYKLFSFADPADYALMVVGMITAVGSGLCLPLMTLLFGELANSFGQNAETERVVSEVSKVSLKYVYLALGSGVAASSVKVACWMITGERQAARIRNLYLRAILRQDIGYFDRETNTGEIIERMSTDTIIIQDAMGQKVGKFLQLSASFFGGFVIAFTKGWLLTTILLSAIPLLVISAASMSVLMAKLTSRGQAAYSAAAVVVEETLGSIRTGLNTMVGVNGTQLSGGQKQRIALARAILKDPRILLLDEATSALDAESERTVQEALDRVMISRTTIVVAHRLSTVKNADSIAVIHQGKIVEKGASSTTNEEQYAACCQSPSQSQQGSSGTGNSSNHSFTTSAGLLTAANVVEKVYRESQTPPSSQHKVEHKVSLYRLACLNKQETPELVLGSLAAMVNGAILPLLGLLLSSMIKAFYEPPHKLRKESKFWACMFLVLGMASLLATPLRTYFFAVAGCKLIKRIRSRCFEKVVHMEISWFDRIENSSSAVGSRLSVDATSMRNLVGESLAILVQNISTAIAGLIIGFGASWELSLVILVMLPLIGLNGYLHMKFITGFSADTKKLYEDATQVASDAVGSIRTVASFCAEEKVMKLHQEKCEAPVRLGTRQGLLSGAGFGISLFFLYSVYAAGYYVGARLVDAGKINFGDVFRHDGHSNIPVGALAPDSGKANTGAASIFALLDRKSRIDSSDSSGMTLENVNGGIVFQHVSFRKWERQVHNHIIQRFYDPDSGQITLDGIGIQKLNLKWFRQQIGLVSQEPVLFNDTVRANIAYGKEGNATEAEVVAAAELANAHKFISGMQKGYETMVGEKGIQLSGGQKQRVAIARAIVKAPKILLLDEATSALDAESEKVVQDALDRVVVDRTTIVVAHRLSTIRNADLIVVLRNGVVAEKGRHGTLINKKDGVYASLVALHGDGNGVSS
ncbi:UNVERIFIED_CONTAM: ABC transporter B family member 11 [Sesamum calycinum]|uniref:ABC transporter B family member 11 n=1 Tax=Sesamum calycinum TaxID=2727403 RepID=A0AAW2NGP4_9LAMI